MCCFYLLFSVHIMASLRNLLWFGAFVVHIIKLTLQIFKMQSHVWAVRKCQTISAAALNHHSNSRKLKEERILLHLHTCHFYCGRLNPSLPPSEKHFKSSRNTRNTRGSLWTVNYMLVKSKYIPTLTDKHWLQKLLISLAYFLISRIFKSVGHWGAFRSTFINFIDYFFSLFWKTRKLAIHIKTTVLKLNKWHGRLHLLVAIVTLHGLWLMSFGQSEKPKRLVVQFLTPPGSTYQSVLWLVPEPC